MKRIHCFQHVPFENPGTVAEWIQDRGHALDFTRFFDGELPPTMEGVDLLLVMGGPMGVDDRHLYPWLEPEMEAIDRAIAAGKAVLGICLGAQLVAKVLGATVQPNDCKEIGWFPISADPGLDGHPLGRAFPSRWPALHWHGDTFDIPAGASRLGSSQGCRNQGFFYGERVVGLQFHLEVTRQGATALVSQCARDLAPGPWIATADEILAEDAPFEDSHRLMGRLLDLLENRL